MSMDRGGFLKRLAALPAVLAVGGASEKDVSAADADAPFTSRTASGERIVEAGEGAWLNDIEGISWANNHQPIDRVKALNWDAPWVEHYPHKPQRSDEVIRTNAPFIIRYDGRTYRSRDA